MRESDARACAEALKERWRDGRLELHDDESHKLMGTCLGFETYAKTLQEADPVKQRANSLVMKNELLPQVRRFMPGFATAPDPCSGCCRCC